MYSLSTSLLVMACVFAGGLLGLYLPRLLPPGHVTKETQDVVRLGTGMISVLASLVLGLLISTAKGTSDNTDQSMRAFAADLILLDETLRDYGDSAREPRNILRRYVARALEDHWPTRTGSTAEIDNRQTGLLLERVRERIRALQPVDAGQTWLQGEALKINSSLLQQRWLLIERSGETIRPIMVAILVSWIFFIFVSFGLNAPLNGTVLTAFLIAAFAIGCAVFLVLELDSPFAGTLRISSKPMRNVLVHMDD